MMWPISIRSAYWLLVLFILAASALVATDIEDRKSPSYTHHVVTGSIR